MAKSKYSFWEISFYISMLIILFWLVFKLTGIINTPPFLQYGLPILSAVYGFFSLYKDLVDKIHRLEKGLTRLWVKVETIEKDIELLKTK